MFTVLQTSAFGLYIALQENDHRTHPYLIQGTKYSFKRVRENEIENIWPKIPMNQSLYYLHLNAHLDQVTYLKEQLCERRRNTNLFVNNKVDKKSHGKRILTRSGAYWQSNVEFFSNKNEPLYVYSTYLAENDNGDICFLEVKAVVVKDVGGILRFRYQGNSSESNFDPYEICCGSSCNIIFADMKTHKLHMIDKNCVFLHHVTYEGIRMPQALSIEENDNMYEGE